MKPEKIKHRFDGIRFQVIGSILTGAFFVSTLVTKRLGWEAVAVFFATAVTLASLVALFTSWLARSAAVRASQLARRDSEIAKISMEEAKARAVKLLTAATRFKCVNANEPYSDTLNVMPPQLGEFFSQYARVTLVF